MSKSTVINFTEKANLTALIFILLALNLLTFVPQTNEEQYLLYAHQFFNPEWIPGSVMATEFPGARLLFEYIFGPIVHFVGFEATVFFGRLVTYFLLAIPLAKIFKRLNFSNLQALLLLQIFVLTKQSFYAGEWIFGGIEAKSVAYIFLFWGVLFLLREKYFRAFACTVAATYFHVLIGGWFAVSVFLVLLFRRMPFAQIFKLGLFYGVLILPLLLYLASGIFAGEVNTDLNLNHIYVYFRNKHHVGLFASFDFFFRRHFFNICLAAAVVFYLWQSKKVRDFLHGKADLTMLRGLVLAMSAIGFIYVIIGLADNLFFDLSGGFLLKSYPFRMQGLALLFTLFIEMAFFTRSEKQQNIWRKIRPYFVVLILLIACTRCGVNVKNMLTYQSDADYNAVIDYLKNETPQPSTVLVLGKPGDNTDDNRHKNKTALDLMRRTRRDNFVHYKYIPATPAKMAEWYKRLQLVRNAERDVSLTGMIAKNYDIDYVLCPAGTELPYVLVLEAGEYWIYEVAE